MRLLQNEKGVTLLEVLLSVVILSIVLFTFLNFFPQMGLTNNFNQDKIQAVNSAREVLVKWQNSDEVKDFLDDPSVPLKENADKGIQYDEDEVSSTGDHYTFKTNVRDFDVEIKIKKSSDLVSTPSEARQIHVQMLNDNSKVVSESYGYVMLD